MKFLIQKVDGKVVHDFSLTLLESIRFQKWLGNDVTVKYVNTIQRGNNEVIVNFKDVHKNYVPVGSVEFVCEFLKTFYNVTPLPINVPEVLFKYAGRVIFNGDEAKLLGKWFAKSNDKIKYFANVINENTILEKGNYQYSEMVDIDSEWRCFVYKNKIVGLQNYSGAFATFPNMQIVDEMIRNYAHVAPIAYSLDVFINDEGTFVMECHDFFSCGLYGFSDHTVYPQMLHRWFKEYIKQL
jgi:hypothetical protein